MRDATDTYREMINIGKRWVKKKAKLVKEFPVLRNEERGLVVGASLGHYYHKVLLPNGKLAWFRHSTWGFGGYLSDKHYLSRITMNEVEQAVKAHCNLSAGQSLKRKWRFSFL